MKKSESFAIDQWLSDVPENWSYQQILDYLRRHTWHGSASEISPWEIVEDCTGEAIAGFIEDTRQAFERYTA